MVASLTASKPAGGGLDAQAAEATTGRREVDAIAEVPHVGAACGVTAEGLGAPPVELSHGSRSPAEAARLASSLVSPLAARSLIVKPWSEDGINCMRNLLTASYLTGRSKSKSTKLVPCSDTCTLFRRLPPCASASDNALAFFVAARPTGQNTRQQVLAVAFSALVGIGSLGGGTRGGQLKQPILPAVEQTAEPADLAGS